MSSAPLDVFHCPLDGINLIEASAGTGKTWTICGLYLRLLLERELTVQQILVVTFTQAATAELRKRIRARIVDMSNPARDVTKEGDRFVPDLLAKLDSLGIDPEKRRALLQRALESFDEAAILTIHGFCQRALADNPFSAGLPMRTELVEDDNELLMEAVHDFWRRHVASDSVSADFARYLYGQDDSPKKFARLLKRHLAKPLAQYLWPLDIDVPLVATKRLDPLFQKVCATWESESAAIIDVLRKSLSQLNGHTYKSGVVLEGASDWTRLCRGNRVLGQIGQKALLYRSSVLEDRTKKNCTRPFHAFFDQAEDYCALRERIEASFASARLRLLRRLFDEAASQLRELKVSRQVISFNDMLSNVHERLNNPAFPWLAPSVKARFPAALIDEFQDTDPLQFAIFRGIYGNTHSQVFVVGDPKQAIYGFRHADLHTYLRAKSWIMKEWSLADNQRSSKPLVTALNGLFEMNDRAFILPHLDYRHVEYGKKRRSAFVDDTDARAPLRLWALPRNAGGHLRKPEAKAAAVQATCAEIARLIQAATRGEITLDGRPLRPRDIAVLVRTRALGTDIKRGLAALRVGAVEMSRNSVFHSVEAFDLETVLTAVLSPSRESRVRAALATDLIGCGMKAIEAISGDETLLMERMQQFMEYRDYWLRQGFGVMYRRLLTEQCVAQRMLERFDGERRLTNFLHLGEILQQAAESCGAPDALLRHLKSARDEDSCTDATLLRLESDQNLVQIVTIHSCKGLEYPVVFCPFVCDGATKWGGPALEGLEYHDDLLESVIDFREGSDKDDPRKVVIKKEQAAESVRLLYVALTRAVHRCYLVVGCYESGRSNGGSTEGGPTQGGSTQGGSTKESIQSLLNWLVAGRGIDFSDWLQTAVSADHIEAAWRDFAQSQRESVTLSPLPVLRGTPLAEENGSDILDSRPMSVVAAGAWRLSSYSGLSFGALAERAADDRDARVASTNAQLVLPAVAGVGVEVLGVGEGDILRFPRGPSAGECIHAVFEEIDFTDESTWDGAVAGALRTHPQSLPDVPEPLRQRSLAGMLRTLVRDVTETAILPGLRLRSLSRRQRLTELEFVFPTPHLSAAALNTALRSLGYAVPELRFGQLQGYLTGFIDLVFEHQGRYFILDWKSNHLGYHAADYAAEPVAEAMAAHGYHLQYLLYTVALDRYLRLKLKDYRYETHVGGVLYLFVRGVRPDWMGGDGTSPGVYGTRPGVFFHRPTLAAIERLNDLLENSVAETR